MSAPRWKQKGGFKWGKSKYAKPVEQRTSGLSVTLSLLDCNHFCIINRFNEVLNGMYRAKGGVYDRDERRWRVPMPAYHGLVKDLKSLTTPQISLEEIPSFVLEVQKSASWEKRVQLAKLPPLSAEDTWNALDKRISKSLCEKLLPFQRMGILSAIERQGRVLIGDEMGLGKTVQAIVIALYYQQDWPLLIVTPSSLRLTWAAEIKRWIGLDEDSIQILFKSKEKCKKLVCIVSFDLAARMKDHLVAKKYKSIIVDESHYLKTADAKRTKAITPIIKTAKRAILLSGTPALSRPIELFTQLNALVPNIFRTATSFGKRYCAGHQTQYGWDFNGSSNLPELHCVLNGSVVVRRLKKDVLKDLPPKIRQQVHVEPPPKKAKILAELLKQHKRVSTDRSASDNEKRAIMMKLYRETGLAKVSGVLEYISDLLEKNIKFLIFGHHSDVLDMISEHLSKKRCKFIRIDGSTPPNLRQALCDVFQQDEKCRAAVLSITAAGIGLTLHAASCVVFAELFWNPGSLLQCEDRAHRVGNKETVDVKYLLCRGSLDDVQWALVQRKVNVLGKSIDGTRGQMDVVSSQADQKQILDFFGDLQEVDSEIEQLSETGIVDAQSTAADVATKKRDAADSPVNNTAVKKVKGEVICIMESPIRSAKPAAAANDIVSIVIDDAEDGTCPTCGKTFESSALSSHVAQCMTDLTLDMEDDDDDWS